MEGRDLLRNHDTAIDELLHHRADPLMDHDLGEDQDGKRDEKPYVRLDVVEEGEGHGTTGRASSDERKDEQRQPRDRGDDDRPPLHQVERRFQDAGADVELVQRPTQDEREVGRQHDAHVTCSMSGAGHG